MKYCCYKLLASLLLFFLSLLQPSSSLFLPLPMYGYITTSWYHDIFLSKEGHDPVENPESLCSMCNSVVQGGTEVLYLHYLASHLEDEGMTSQMAGQNLHPNTSSSPSQPLLPPPPSPINLTQIPSTSASTSNPSNPLLGLNRKPLLPVQNQAPQRDQLALNNPNQAVPSSSSVIRPQRPHQEQGVRINNDGQVPEQNSPPVIQYMYMRRRRRGNAHQGALSNQPAQDVIDVGSDFEEGSSDSEDIDLDSGI
ncbi:unnamed protein product [Prunus brigantina]